MRSNSLKMATKGSGSAPIPQPSCPVYLRSIAVTNIGLIRQHGPLLPPGVLVPAARHPFWSQR